MKNHLCGFFMYENCRQTNRLPSTTVKISLPQKYWRPRRPLHEALDCPVEYKIPTKIAPEKMLVETKLKVTNRRSIRGKLLKSCKAVVGIHSPMGGIGATMARTKLSRRPKPDKKLILLTAFAKRLSDLQCNKYPLTKSEYSLNKHTFGQRFCRNSEKRDEAKMNERR